LKNAKKSFYRSKKFIN